MANSPYPPLIPDVQAIFEMESEAMRVSQSLDRLMEELTGTLHGVRMHPYNFLRHSVDLIFLDVGIDCKEC